MVHSVDFHILKERSAGGGEKGGCRSWKERSAGVGGGGNDFDGNIIYFLGSIAF